jgi:hypothetical protein
MFEESSKRASKEGLFLGELILQLLEAQALLKKRFWSKLG